jgi:hypothetical protein
MSPCKKIKKIENNKTYIYIYIKRGVAEPPPTAGHGGGLEKKRKKKKIGGFWLLGVVRLP